METEVINNRTWTFEYKVESLPPGTFADGNFAASTPYRQITWIGETEQEAIGSMLRGVAELAWKGALNPSNPHGVGDEPIQHVMQVLETKLSWHLDRRREDIDRQRPPEPWTVISTGGPSSPELLRRNEIISGLATAIAALARIKEF